MIDNEVVRECPVVLGTLGQIVISPTGIAQIVGLLEDQRGMEWALLGWGTVDMEGQLIHVDRFTVPKQNRSSGQVVIEEHDQTEELVLVVHSHHSMGAWFSSTDLEELNPLYRSSIVVAELESKKSFDSPTADLVNLGFDYQAVMRVRLPCGDVGEIRAEIVVEGQLARRAGWNNFPTVYADFGDCQKVVDSPVNLLQIESQPKCGPGWVPPVLKPARAAWGSSDSLLQDLKAATKHENLRPSKSWGGKKLPEAPIESPASFYADGDLVVMLNRIVGSLRGLGPEELMSKLLELDYRYPEIICFLAARSIDPRFDRSIERYVSSSGLSRETHEEDMQFMIDELVAVRFDLGGKNC